MVLSRRRRNDCRRSSESGACARAGWRARRSEWVGIHTGGSAIMSLRRWLGPKKQSEDEKKQPAAPQPSQETALEHSPASDQPHATGVTQPSGEPGAMSASVETLDRTWAFDE